MPGIGKKAKPVFKGMVIAKAGQLPHPFSDENLAKWIKNHSGQYSLEFDDSVSHLIVTRELFDENGKRVKEAKKRKKPKIDVVDLDWFELAMANERKPNISDYSFLVKKKKADAKKRHVKKQAKGLREGVGHVNTNMYHPYKDNVFFEYKIILRRDSERMELALFESNAKPHLYVCAIKYWKRPRTKPSTMRLAHTDGSVERELRRFGHAFLKKTGVPWDKRLAHADKKTGIVVGPASRDDRWYSYQMPTGGKPIGLIRGMAVDPPCFGEQSATPPAGLGSPAADAGEDGSATESAEPPANSSQVLNAKDGRLSVALLEDPEVRKHFIAATNEPATASAVAAGGGLNAVVNPDIVMTGFAVPDRPLKPSDKAAAAIAARKPAVLEAKRRRIEGSTSTAASKSSSFTGSHVDQPMDLTLNSTPSPPNTPKPSQGGLEKEANEAIASVGPQQWKQTSIASHIVPAHANSMSTANTNMNSFSSSSAVSNLPQESVQLPNHLIEKVRASASPDKEQQEQETSTRQQPGSNTSFSFDSSSSSSAAIATTPPRKSQPAGLMGPPSGRGGIINHKNHEGNSHGRAGQVIPAKRKGAATDDAEDKVGLVINETRLMAAKKMKPAAPSQQQRQPGVVREPGFVDADAARVDKAVNIVAHHHTDKQQKTVGQEKKKKEHVVEEEGETEETEETEGVVAPKDAEVHDELLGVDKVLSIETLMGDALDASASTSASAGTDATNIIAGGDNGDDNGAGARDVTNVDASNGTSVQPAEARGVSTDAPGSPSGHRADLPEAAHDSQLRAGDGLGAAAIFSTDEDEDKDEENGHDSTTEVPSHPQDKILYKHT